MPAKYSIVQYVPNPVADERINVGVLTWDDSRAHARFTNNWNRAQQFGNENPEFLRSFANDISRMAISGESPSYIEKISRTWHDSIQLTPPRGSLDDAIVLLDIIASRVLVGPVAIQLPALVRVAERSARRTKSFAARAAYRHVLNAMKDIAPDRAKHLVKKRESIRGEIVPHQFDVVVGNGTPIAGVKALSFEVAQTDALLRDIDAAAWAVDDVRNRDDQMPLAVFMLPPTEENENLLFDRATRTFRGLQAAVMTTEIGIIRWAHARAELIAAH